MVDVRTVGVILAGGQSRRMDGKDKSFARLRDKPLFEYVLDRIYNQVLVTIVNSNGDPDRFDRYGLPVVADVVPGFAGPLVGVLSGLEWTKRNAPGCPWIASFPVDTPFLPDDLLEKLRVSLEEAGADLACARSNGRDHPVIALWPVRLAEDLRRAIEEEGVRKVEDWTGRYKIAKADWGDVAPDPFMNVNSPQDMADAAARSV